LTESRGSSLATATRAVLAVADALEAACAQLCQLDAVAGDGDHGLAMARAAQAIRAKLTTNPPKDPDKPPKDVTDLIELMAAEFAAVGGAMGAIAYVLLHAVADSTADMDGNLTAPDIVRLLDVAQQTVTEFGGARPGDKTILDAISKAAEAAADQARLGKSPIPCLQAAARGARRGADATSGMVARIGRASRLGELSRGTVDAGAQSFALSLEALATAYALEAKK
jgi:dihydroxyacetone kinase-like protein